MPGNVPPYHAVSIGSPFKPLEYDHIVEISNTGLKKGRYAVPAGPWVSDDDSIAVVDGTVDGWCYFVKTSNTAIWNYSGNLSVTDSDLGIINLHPREEEEEYAPESCDDPYTDIIEEDCDEYPSGPRVTGGDSHSFTPAGQGQSHLVCIVTDWYESNDGGITYHYVDTSVDYCWFE